MTDVSNVVINCAQGQWTWFGGLGAPIYGTKGVAAAGIGPGDRAMSSGWTDASGNFWLFGGINAFTGLSYGDLWQYDPKTALWTWVGGTNISNCGPVFGTKGVADATSQPGCRSAAPSWIDSAGNLWLFGGSVHLGSGTFAAYNDLWSYSPTTGLWTWVGGSNVASPGVYGTKGHAAAANTPPAGASGASWMDLAGSFWLFGGAGVDDLWEFSPSTGFWTWVAGSNTQPAPGVYGTIGIPAATNTPGARTQSSTWTDSAGNLWLFGGLSTGRLNDLWMFNPSTGNWTWIDGSNTTDAIGVFGSFGVPAVGNVPAARYGSVSWTDKKGNLWLFGGQSTNQSSFGAADLWEYSIGSGLWTWAGGSNETGAAPMEGIEGTPGPGNMPGMRLGSVAWTDNAGSFWLFGGYVGTDFPGDLWKFSP